MLAPLSAGAATSLLDDFDAGLEGWQGNTTQTAVSHAAAGGNPGGYLQTSNDTFEGQSFNAVGMVQTGPDYSGNFADGLWTVSFDTQYIRGSFVDSLLRFRYLNSSFNGWTYSFAAAASGTEIWHSYTVSFDTTWSDAQALAAGWVQEATSSSWTSLFDTAYTSEVRLRGQSQSVLCAGIDNCKVVGPSAVPLPASAALIVTALGGLGLFGLRRRRV